MSSYSDTILGLSPAGYWELDELNGPNLSDSSGNDRTATITVSASLGEPSLLPNGIGAAIRMTDDGQIISTNNPLNSGESFSIGGWFSGITNSGNNLTALFADSITTSYGWVAGYEIGRYGTDTFRVYKAYGSFVTMTAPGIADGSSHHVLFVFDHENDSIDCYLDGNLADSVSTALNVNQSSGLYICGWINTQLCTIDSVVLFPYALTETNVLDIYNSASVQVGYTVSGTLTLDGLPFGGTVRAYSVPTGELLASGISNPGNGGYVLNVPSDDDVYVMAIDGAGVRPLVHGPISSA